MLKMTRSLFFAVACFCIGVQAQQADPWKKFTSAEGKFSVLMPCTPEVTSEDIKEGSISTKQVYHTCTYGKAAYTISYAPFSNALDAKAMLDNFRNGIVKGSNGTLASEKDISLSSFPGRAFSTKGTTEGTEIRYDWRIYLIDKRVYSIGFVTRAADLDGA